MRHTLLDCLIEPVHFALFEFVLHRRNEPLETKFMLVRHYKLVRILHLKGLPNILDIIPIVVEKVVFVGRDEVKIKMVQSLFSIFVLKCRNAFVKTVFFVLIKILVDGQLFSRIIFVVILFGSLF